MKKHLLTIVMLLCPPFFFATLFAQHNVNQCHAHIALAEQLAANPRLKAQLEANERFIADFSSRAQLRGGAQIMIPTVVHVVSASVTDAQVLSQIEALNRDFNKQNTDVSRVPNEFKPLIADCEIKFQLAARTPDNKATNGIVRHTSSRTEWGGSDDVKKPAKGGFAPWNTSKYLNIYVCPIGNGVLGYASFPGTPAEVDGVVIDPTAFGTTGSARRPFNLGRTCAHEVAHWMNLYHIWGDATCGDDHCADTPPQKEAHYGDPSAPTYSNCNGTQTRNMSMNFMDYVNDASMVMFTTGQKVRMQAMLNGVRASLLTSNGCVPPVEIGCKIKGLNISELKTTAVTLSWTAISGTITYTIDIKKTGATDWISISSTKPTITLTDLAAKEYYTVRIKSDCSAAEYSELLTFSTRPVVKTLAQREGTYQIYPNPVNDEANFFFDGKFEGNIKLQIVDARGLVHYQTTKTVGKDNPSVTVDTTTLAVGVYIVTVEHNGELTTKKLIKN